jgi:hypothetical protein
MCTCRNAYLFQVDRHFCKSYNTPSIPLLLFGGFLLSVEQHRLLCKTLPKGSCGYAQQQECSYNGVNGASAPCGRVQVAAEKAAK